jgi:hypothetical protein
MTYQSNNSNNSNNKQSASQNNEGKDSSRVEAGKKAAETRKAHEGQDAFKKMGQKGGSSTGNKSDNNR